MAVTGNYSSFYAIEVVTVEQIGAKGAVCRTAYGAEINVLWGVNLPSPVPAVGDKWYIEKVTPTKWAFSSKVTGTAYSLMRFSMSLDLSSCIGRERSVIDDIAGSGVSEVYLTVADGGAVYWDSSVAVRYGLATYSPEHLRQVVKRCSDNGLSVVLVFDCRLWSDIGNRMHNYYQQAELSESYVGAYGWYSLLDSVWDDVDNYTWEAVRKIGSASEGDMSYLPVWSFLTAASAVSSLVLELYSEYADSVRGVCFKGWRIGGAYADVSYPMADLYSSACGGSIFNAMVSGRFSDDWWEARGVIADFYAGVQRDFVSSVKSAAPGWPVSVIVPSQQLCLSSERMGRFETWLADDFSSYGWARVGCRLDYSKSVDRSYELRSFEFLTASLGRFAEYASALYIVDVSASDDYGGMFDVLSKYNVTNVLLDDYGHWRMLSDKQASDLKLAMNAASVTPMTVLDEVGFYLSNNSRDVSFYDNFDVNRFQRSAQDFCAMLLDKLPHRLRVLYDGDLSVRGFVRGLSSLVLYHSLNMDDEQVDSASGMIGGGTGVVIVGRCGMYQGASSERRKRLPFPPSFGDSDAGAASYENQVMLRAGRIGPFDEVYVMDGECAGARPVIWNDPSSEDTDAIGFDAAGNEVAVPLRFNGRSSILSVDIIDEDALMGLASEMTLYAIGRDA